MTLFESGMLALFLGALVVKPSELPTLGRRAGRLAGRAVRRFQDMKRELGDYVDKNELRLVQEELEHTMSQLNKIRQDVRSVSSVQGIVMDFSKHNTAGSTAGEVKTAMIEDTEMKERKADGGVKVDGVRAGAGSQLPYDVLPVSARDVRLAQEEVGTSTNSSSSSRKPKSEDLECSGSALLRETIEDERIARAASQFLGRQRAPNV
jgi:Sec-independent protein translocase protein TatA